MQKLGSINFQNPASQASFRPAALFLLAVSALTLMSVILEPGLGLPLLAFFAMAALTWILGLRLFQDLAEAANQAN